MVVSVGPPAGQVGQADASAVTQAGQSGQAAQAGQATAAKQIGQSVAGNFSECVDPQCRSQRRNEILASIMPCVDSPNTSACMRERNRERWEMRVQTMEAQCEGDPDCMARAGVVDECSDKAPGLERAECARTKLNLGRQVSVQARECSENQSNRTECMQSLRENVYTYSVVKMQDLADRGEMLVEEGLDEDDANEFSALVEDAIMAFGEAGDITGKKRAVLEIRSAWQNLVGRLEA
jgi:hypothetical protein